MLDGIYSITFRGRADWGMGMIILQRGSINQGAARCRGLNRPGIRRG